MKPETKIILSILVLAPVLGELITGSMPPTLFFYPLAFIRAALVYGCGALLIREAKARWKLQWSVIFLAIAYGIIEEGIMVHSFFNTEHADLGVLAGYAMYFGVQWGWTIALIMFHATSSTLIPIVMVGLLWPEYKDKPVLKKRGLLLTFIGYLTVIIAWIILMVVMKSDVTYANYDINIGHMIVSVLVVVLLVLWSYKYKTSRIITSNRVFSTFKFGILGFLFMAFILFGQGLLAQLGLPGAITIIIQLFIVLLTILFLKYQIYNENITKRHVVTLITGTILFWIFLSPVYEFFPESNADPTQGMLIVGIVSLILLIIWRKIVLKKQ